MRCIALFGILITGLAALESPQVVEVGAVAPDVLAVVIQDGRVERDPQRSYQAQPGDERRKEWVLRGGVTLGALAADGTLRPVERLVGAWDDRSWLSDDDALRLVAPAGVKVVASHRRSRPVGKARVGPWNFGYAIEHTLFLRLDAPLETGQTYRLAFSGARLPALDYVHLPATSRSPAIHVNQLGYRAEDPGKRAIVACWLGDGGALTLPEDLGFALVDSADGAEHHRGTLVRAKRPGEGEDAYHKDYNGTEVWHADFEHLRRPGTYRVVVDGIGCSLPVTITAGAGPWAEAFATSVHGLAHQRSGIAIGPPWSETVRPRCFHGDDGVVVYHSACPLMDSGNGLNARGTDANNFANLVAGATDEVVPDAWGGYFDAGDWDRRIQHLEATRLQLELLELRGDAVAGDDLGTPDSGNGRADLLDEAEWNLACYRRMQTAEGGIRGGIESAEHPHWAEGSWQESLTVYAYAPGIWSSYLYAASAAAFARSVAAAQPEFAAGYAASARRAMAWAEAEHADHDYGDALPAAVRDARNLAAVQLYRLDGEERWHRLFLDTLVVVERGQLRCWAKDKTESHDQAEAAFAYLRCAHETDATVSNGLRQVILTTAAHQVELQAGSGYGYLKLDEWTPVAWGVAGPVSQAVNVVRAHALSADPTLLRALVIGCGYGLGANPMDRVMTTGLGQRPIQHAFWADTEVGAQPPPKGISVYGAMDLSRGGKQWAIELIGDDLHPPAAKWPAMSGYFDVSNIFPMTEFTVMQTLGPNAYVWGYLAGR